MAVALVMFVGVFIFAFDMEKYNVPPQEMKAPFGDVGKAAGQFADTASTRGGLETQNFSGREIGYRLTEIVAETLSFDKGNYVYNLGAMEKYFTQTGYAQYKQFLTGSQFQQTLETQNLQSGAYVQQEPLELTSGAIGGAYKWLFEVPVTISFIPKDSESYRDGAVQPQNRDMILRVQFTRVRDEKDPEAVKIELWQVLPPRRS